MAAVEAASLAPIHCLMGIDFSVDLPTSRDHYCAPQVQLMKLFGMWLASWVLPIDSWRTLVHVLLSMAMEEAVRRLISRFVAGGMEAYSRKHCDSHQRGFVRRTWLLKGLAGVAEEVATVDANLPPLNDPWRPGEADARSAVDGPYLNQSHCSWEAAEAATLWVLLQHWGSQLHILVVIDFDCSEVNMEAAVETQGRLGQIVNVRHTLIKP